MASLMASYGRLPISLTRGEGPWVWDTQGKRYLDGLGGIAVTALGHANEPIAAAISDQARSLTHCSNLYEIPFQESLGDALCEISGMDKAFFCNSGAEANEAAIKVARLHGHQQGIENPTIVVMSEAFHGRTLATLTATGNRKIQAGFEPLVPGFVRAPFSDLDALEKIAENSRNIVGVMLEPIQGEGGIRPAMQGYLTAVRQLCDQHNWLMIADEIQTGMGRTGKWFACHQENVLPDVMTVAKALGNGFPVGACLARGAAADLIQPGTHGTTFGGNPLACRVGLTVIEEIRKNNLVERAGELGTRLAEGFGGTIGKLPGVVEIRGKGLMLGIELDRDCTELVKMGLEAGVLINVTAGRVVRLLPPYIMSDEEADELVSRVSSIVTALLTKDQETSAV